MRTVYLDGQYIAANEAKVSVFDRGFLFADAVYEVVSVLGGRLVDFEPHWVRLQHSATEIQLPCPIPRDDLIDVCRTLVASNTLEEGLIYLQISRGPAERDFAFPEDPRPTLVAFTQAKAISNSEPGKHGIRVVTLPDIRWARCDIKSVGLLAASLAKQTAIDQGADDAWMTRDAHITEGSSSNAYIVTADDTLVTRHLGNEILAGITRAALMQLAETRSIRIQERAIHIDELAGAKEAFASAASMFVTPVVAINSFEIGDGKPGPISQLLREAYLSHAQATSI